MMKNRPKQKPKRILVVDDEAQICKVIQKILVQEGHHVLVACNGPEALAKLKKGGVDLMLIDLKMPAMDGLEVLKLARTIQKKLRSIILTAYGTVTSAREAMCLGVFDFLTKPFDNRLLKKVVREALR